ncbi:MAG: hypothetical protein WD097_09520, partial [Balneolales bacterium]
MLNSNCFAVSFTHFPSQEGMEFPPSKGDGVWTEFALSKGDGVWTEFSLSKGDGVSPLERGRLSTCGKSGVCSRVLFLPFKTWLAITLLLLTLSGLFTTARSQTIPVGDLREEQLRIQQLLNDSLSTSFVNRPVWDSVYDRYMDAAVGEPGWWNRKLVNREYNLGRFNEYGEGFTLGIYDPIFRTTTNSSLPFGQNNGAAWYGKGF